MNLGSGSIVQHSGQNEQKLPTLLAHAMLGRRLLPVQYVVDGHCSCPSHTTCTKIGKHARIADWQTRATDDLDQIREWHHWVPQANWGWLQHDTFALDVDPGRGGLESLAQWEENAGGPERTLMQRTQSGGYHFIYRQTDPPLRASGDMLPGIEVRGQGSYIMIDPSVGLHGRWTLLNPDVAPAEADEFTLQLIAKNALFVEATGAGEASKQNAGAAGDTSEKLPGTDWFMRNGLGAFSGSRNRDAYRLAWRLLRLGKVHPTTYTTTRIAGIMKACWEATDQGNDPFPWDECLGTLRSAWRRMEKQDTEEAERQRTIAKALAGEITL
jgi:hypothetical protein